MLCTMDETEARTWMYRAVCDGAGVPPESQWEAFASCFRLRSLSKGAHWISAGQTTSAVAFVAEGLLRMYYLREDGREFNKTFVYSPDFVGVLEALLTGESSRLSVQCLEPTTLLEVEHARACAFYERHPYWERFGRLFAERLYVKKARREAALLVESPANRYRTFLKEHASLEQRVPDYHIASYLGITPETLSRLRKATAS
jgi:CRP-like cAMP-binding protein